MQFIVFSAFLILSGASAFDVSPVIKVVALIKNLKTKVETDGKNEQKAYDTYACWCEEQTTTKTTQIADAKTTIDDLQQLITKLGGELASHTVDVKQLTKDLAENAASQKESLGIRDREFKDYSKERSDAEQSIGALESSIKTMTAATRTKTRFLETLQEAQVLSTVGALRSVLEMPVIVTKVSEKDLDLVRRFIEKPDDFGSSAGSMSAMQTGSENNPAGDYAPASNAIQGILKDMYDGLTGSLEGDNVQEAKRQKSYESLLATNKAEAATLTSTLDRATASAADATKKKADSKNTQDDTKEQLDADEKFLALTKKACKRKAAAWSERTRLRIEELQGMQAAIDILGSTKAKSTFGKASTTFLQMSEKLENEVASDIRSGGHFDKVIVMVTNMMAALVEEGAKDIRLRDRCEKNQGNNKNKMEDLTAGINNFKQIISRKKANLAEVKAKGAKAWRDVLASKKTISDMTDQRSTEQTAYDQARNDDLEGISLLKQAVVSLSAFYKDNGIKQTNLLEAVADSDKPPGTWEDDNYGGQKSASTSILAILSMIQEDLEQEVKVGEQNNKVAIGAFESDRKAVEVAMNAQKKTKADADSETAEVMRQIVNKNADKTDLNTDLTGEKEMEKAIAEDCDWIKTDFKKRAAKRDLEMAGLREQKAFLAGASVPPSALR